MSRPALPPLPAARLLACWGLVSLGPVLGLAGCTIPASNQSPQSRADAETWEACRKRADEMYDRQNRAAIYAPNSGINNPQSGAYASGQTDRGLPARFGYEQAISSCVRNTGTGSERSPAASPSVTPQRPAAPPAP